MTQAEAIRFFCTVNDSSWNGFPVQPGRYVCIAPVYGVKERRDSCISLPPDCDVIQDSGAFCDQHHGRLSFAEALDRQLLHADRFGFTDQIVYRATYDTLVRKTVSAAFAAEGVKATVLAAKWMHHHRDGTPLVITAQGKETAQYLHCVQDLMPYFETGDALGLGGWAYTGKSPRRLLPVFRETMRQVIPFAAREGVTHVHVWGVCMPHALSILLDACDEVGIVVSTDSSGPVRNPCHSDWGYGEWRDNSYKRPADRQAFYEDRVRHVATTRQWLADFRSTVNYPPHVLQTRLF